MSIKRRIPGHDTVLETAVSGRLFFIGFFPEKTQFLLPYRRKCGIIHLYDYKVR